MIECQPMPHRDRYLFVCINRRDEDNPKGSCAQKGSEEIAKKLKEALKSRGLAGRLRTCTTSCLDLCEIGAAIVQEPDHVAYGGVTLDDVDAIADAAGRGEVVERLVVHGRAPRASSEERGR
jgi:(2Fe-2S) ferredoxin